MMEPERSAGLLVFFLVLVTTVLVAADENTGSRVSYRLISEIDGSTLAVTERLFVDVPSGTRTLHLSLPKATDVLYVRNPYYGELPYIVDTNGRLEIQNVSAGIYDPTRKENEVEVGMASKGRVAIKGSVLEYVLVFAPAMQNNTASFEHVLKLPAGSSIAMVVPQAKILEEENGRRSVYWKADATAGRPGPEVFLARFERKQEGLVEPSRLLGYLVAAIVLLVAGFAAGRLSFAAFRAYKKRKLVASLGLLDEKEEKTLSLVVEAGAGGILQNQLLKGTQYTKSNLSKIVSRLASRGLLAKKRNGKIQKITPGPNLPL